MKLRCLLLGLLVLIAGCATVPKPGCVKIGPYGQICPLPPRALPAVDVTHIVTITHNDESHTFMGRLHVGSKWLRLAGSSLFGTHLFTVTYDGDKIVMQPHNDKLHPELVVALLEVALADPDAMQPRLHGLKLKVKQKGSTSVKTLFEYGHLVALIKRTGASVGSARFKIKVPSAHLTIMLKPLGSTQ